MVDADSLMRGLALGVVGVRGTGLNCLKVCVGFKGLMQKHRDCFLSGFKYLHFSYSDWWSGGQANFTQRERKSPTDLASFMFREM